MNLDYLDLNHSLSFKSVILILLFTGIFLYFFLPVVMNKDKLSLTSKETRQVLNDIGYSMECFDSNDTDYNIQRECSMMEDSPLKIRILEFNNTENTVYYYMCSLVGATEERVGNSGIVMVKRYNNSILSKLIYSTKHIVIDITGSDEQEKDIDEIIITMMQKQKHKK